MRVLQGILGGLGVHAPRSTRRPRLEELYNRRLRGLLHYEPLPVITLRRYCAQRSLPSGIDLTKIELITELEAEDDEGVFDRFTALPPELRVRIYRLYFKSFNALHAPEQPPITRVSRLLRGESLPIFYQSCHFRIVIMAGTKPSLSADSQKFFDAIPAKHLKQTQWLTVDCQISRRIIRRWGLELGNNIKETVAEYRGSTGGSSIIQVESDRIRNEICKALGIFAGERRGNKLRMERLYRLLAVSWI